MHLPGGRARKLHFKYQAQKIIRPLVHFNKEQTSFPKGKKKRLHLRICLLKLFNRIIVGNDARPFKNMSVFLAIQSLSEMGEVAL